LGFLQQASQLDADLVGELIELLVFLFDQVYKLTDLALKVVKALAKEYALLQSIQHLVNGWLTNVVKECLVMCTLLGI